MRVAFGDALELVLSHPSWWVVAAAGFLARGGVLLLLVPLIDLPSPVTATLIFGIDAVSGSGQPSDRLVTTLLLLALGVLAAALVTAIVAAWADALLVGRITRSEEDGLPMARRVLRLSWVQPLGLLPALVAFGLAVPSIRDAVVSEFLLPSAPEVPFLVRVLEGAQGPLLRAVAVLVVCEAVVTVMTRFHLAGQGDPSAAGSYLAALGWMARHPLTTALTWLVGAAVLLGAATIGLAAVGLAWERVGAALLGPATPEPGNLFTVSLLFVTVWLAAIVLLGVASAVRSTLWTLALTVQPAEPSGVRWRADAHA